MSELEAVLGVPVLASIPKSRVLRRRSDFDGHDADAAEEPFRLLRASLRHAEGDSARRSVLITSAREGSGKTTIATHLAAALASGGLANVLLIEADLRRPRLAKALNLPAERGLSTLLQTGLALGPSTTEHVFRIRLGRGGNGGRPGEPEMLGFDVLPAGPPPSHPSEMLESDAMRELLEAAAATYDLVVIEAPPPTLVSDAIPLMKLADGVVIVGRLGRESEPQLRELRGELERFGIAPIGAVANFSRRSKPYYAKRA